MPIENAQRIGPGVAVDRDPEDQLVVLEIIGLGGRYVVRVDQRRDAVLDHAAPGDLLEPDVMLDAGTQEHPEVLVDDRHDVGLEAVEAGERLDLPVALLPQHPVVPSVAGTLADELHERRVERRAIGHEPQGLDQRRHHVGLAAFPQRGERFHSVVAVGVEQLPGQLADPGYRMLGLQAVVRRGGGRQRQQRDRGHDRE